MQDKKKRREEEERKKIYMKIDSHFLRSLETAAPALAPSSPPQHPWCSSPLRDPG